MGGSTVSPFAVNVALYICFLWTGILLLMNLQPRMFLEISVLSAHHTQQRSDVFLIGFQLATHAVSHGGVSEFAFGFWWVYFLWEEERWVFLALIYILMLCKQRQRKNRKSISAQLMLLSTC